MKKERKLKHQRKKDSVTSLFHTSVNTWSRVIKVYALKKRESEERKIYTHTRTHNSAWLLS